MKFLLPLAALYDGITRLLNALYDHDWKARTVPPVRSIGVGNLTVGGTGKTPHIEYLIRQFSETYRITTLSRGYGRSTKGFCWADDTASARSVGDEPMQFYRKFSPQIRVAVGEKRVPAMQRILREATDTELLLFDDVFQHRAVAPHILILLSDYYRPFYQDFVLPAGRLRESRAGAKRADAVVVSKCPPDLSAERQEEITQRVRKYTEAETPVFFSTIRYGQAQPLFGTKQPPQRVLSVSGIARTEAWARYLDENFRVEDQLTFADHHDYTPKDIRRIRERLATCPEGTAVLTTEKDAVKWLPFAEAWKGTAVHYLPIEVAFLGKGFDTWLQARLWENEGAP